jgi:trigger factor
MSVKVETLEHNMAKLTIEVGADRIEEAMQAVYLRNKKQFVIPGFRKGKAPRKIVEAHYGKGVFFDDAVNNILPTVYAEAVEECDAEIFSEPTLNFVQAEAGKDLIFTAEVAVKPEVVLGQYKGLEVKKAVIDVTEDDVMAVIKSEQEKNSVLAPVEDRAVKDGDFTTIDFEGFVDGVAFEGGKGTDYPLTIGSGAFIPGFEEQLVGAEIGKETEVNVTFPEDYHAEDLKGKAAVFKVTVKSIEEKQVPELDDEFASEVSEFETLDEYKESIKKSLTDRKTADAAAMKENEALTKAIENAQMDIPDVAILSEAKNLVREFGMQLQQQGMTLETYMQYTESTEDQLAEQMKPRAERRIASRLVLEAIAKAEGIEVSEEDIEAEYDQMAITYKMDKEELKKLTGDSEAKAIKADIEFRKAGELLVAESVEVEAVEETEEAKAEEN